MAYGFYSTFTVLAAKVPNTDATDYPVGILEAGLARLKGTGSGGHVANANGYDIRPYSDTGLSSALTFQLIYYNATTGALEMYVKRTCSHTTDTDIHLAYGDAGIVTDGSSTSTWNANYKAVYLFGDGSTLSLADSTVNANTLTNTNAVTATAGAIVGGAAAFASGSSQHLDLASAPVAALPITVSCLFKVTTLAANAKLVGLYLGASNTIGTELGGRTGTNVLRTSQGTVSATDTATFTVGAGTWFYTGTRYVSTTDRRVQLNANAEATNATSQAFNTPTQLRIGCFQTNGAASLFWDGAIDEVRISDVDRGVDWLTTEYNNLISPSTFYTIGTEQTVSAGGQPLSRRYGCLEIGHEGVSFVRQCGQEGVFTMKKAA